jgi:hypothetical protein
MDILGIKKGYLVIQMLLIVIWPLLSLLALLVLRGSHLAGTNLAMWALIIVAIPVLGALAFFIIRPEDNSLP